MAELTTEPVGNAPPVSWSNFVDGRVYELVRGVDFHQTPSQARRAFVTWCGRHGYSTHTAVVDDSVIRIKAVKNDAV